MYGMRRQQFFKPQTFKRKYYNSSFSFNLKKDASHVELIKMDIKGDQPFSIINYLHDFIQTHANNMFICTTRTQRLTGAYGDSLYAGHNFVFITDEKGKISSCLSKRATKNVLAHRKRIPDNRFKDNYSPIIPIFAPVYTSFDEEIDIWVDRATKTDYPLFIHRQPITAEYGKKFQSNIENFLMLDREYALHSTFHPSLDRIIPASNCNPAFYKAIFGESNFEIQELFTQHAVFDTIKNLVANEEEYSFQAKMLGLTFGIEYPNQDAVSFLDSFTC